MSEDDQLNRPAGTTLGANFESEHTNLASQIGYLVREQPYGILCTQSQSQPYGSLVALAATDDLTTFVFATPITTRKYRFLSECDHVAVVIDSRSSDSNDLMQVQSVTATGRAHVVPSGLDFEHWAGLLLERHPHLTAFVRAESTALVRIEVVRYFHVCRFQEVRQWIPSRAM
ncbi:MAG: pyridoxamine 5'-phosphate oxidase family protein [Planctomycetota bacterium]